MTRALSTLQYTRLLGILLVAIGLGTAEAQTKITPDPNKYSLQQDIELGQEAAAEARKQLPMLNDSRVDEYVERVGENLVDAIPPEFRHSGFRYTFDVVNQKEINAFALPGGPMFLNRGMIEASRSEAEMAGVMAHEISHVILRHGTAQATKGQKFQIGAVAGANSRSHRRRPRGLRHRSGDSVRAWRVSSSSTAVNTSVRQTFSELSSWREPDTIRAPWPACSRRFRRRAAAAGRSG